MLTPSTSFLIVGVAKAAILQACAGRRHCSCPPNVADSLLTCITETISVSRRRWSLETLVAQVIQWHHEESRALVGVKVSRVVQQLAPDCQRCWINGFASSRSY